MQMLIDLIHLFCRTVAFICILEICVSICRPSGKFLFPWLISERFGIPYAKCDKVWLGVLILVFVFSLCNPTFGE